jgi:hypothetical protein
MLKAPEGAAAAAGAAGAAYAGAGAAGAAYKGTGAGAGAVAGAPSARPWPPPRLAMLGQVVCERLSLVDGPLLGLRVIGVDDGRLRVAGGLAAAEALATVH